MRKSLLLLLSALFVASLPALALAAAKKKQADPNEPGARFVKDGFSQIFVPAQSLVSATQPVKKGKK